MPIINREGALAMATLIDNSGLYSGLRQAENQINNFENFVTQSGKRIGTALGFGLGVAGLKSFASEIINVRGEMQMLESSFEILLGGKGVSGFMSEMKQFAVDSPLSMNGVANAAQTLLGFGIAAEKVMPTIKQIGDISMGNEERFKSLSLAFAQMSATGKLMGQDLLQMINAGFNPLQTISEKTGKSIGDLKKEMESGAISSQMVADAFASATAEGGKFYGMTQKQAEGIRGLQAQLEGGLQDAFNKIGQSQNSLITGGYKTAISLVENYETIGKAIVSIIATYGAYKAALILATQAEAGWNIVQLVTYNRLLLVEKAQKLLNATMLKNPYVLIATLVVGLVTAMWALKDSTTAAEKAQANYNKIKEESIEKEKEHKRRVEELISVLTDNALADLERVSALEELKNKYPEIFKKYDIESIKLADILRLKKEIAETDNKNAINDRKSAYEKALEDVRKAEENLARAKQAPTMRLEQTKKAMRQLEQARANLIPFETDVQNDRINSFIAGIDKMTDAQIKAELNARKRLDDTLQKSGNNRGYVSGGLLSGTFDRSQINQQTSALEAELTKRGQATYTYIDLEKKYNSELSSLQAKRKNIQENGDKLTEEQLKKQLSDIDSQIESKQKEIKDLTGKTPKEQASDNSKAESAADKMREASLKLLNLQAELDSESVRQQLEYEQKLLDIEQDSFDKRYRQNQLNLLKEFQTVEEYRQRIAKSQQDAAKDIYVSKNGSDKGFNFSTFDMSLLPDGLKPSDVEAQVKSLTDAALSSFKKGNADISKELQAFANEERLTFASQLDQQIYSIRAHYAERRQLAKGNADSLKQVNENENKEIIAARLQAHQKQLESDADYNQKYQQLIEDRFVFESDKQRASLEQQIKDQTILFNNLEKQVLNDPNNDELARQLKAAYLQLKLLNKELEKTKGKKLSEIADFAGSIFSSLNSLTDVDLSPVSDMMSTAASFASGDILGGVSSGIATIANIASQFASDTERREQIQRNINKLQQEYNISLRQQNLDLISPIDYARAFRDNIEALQWLVEKGFVSNIDYTLWDELSSKLDLYKKNINEVQSEYDKYLAQSENFLNGFSKGAVAVNSALRGVLAEWKKATDSGDKNATLKALEALGSYDFSYSAKAKDLADQLSSANGEITEITDQLAELSQQMDEFATGTSFDSFLSDASNAIKDLRGDIAGLGEFTEDTLTNAILSSFKYQILSEALKPMYDELADMFLSGNYDASAANDWKQKLTDILNTNSKELDKIFDAFGIDPSDTTDATSKGIASISQDSANELNGNFFALLQKTGDIRNINEASRLLLLGLNNGIDGIQSIMRENSQVFRDSLDVQKRIEQNTFRTAESLDKATNILNKIDTLGVVIRN